MRLHAGLGLFIIACSAPAPDSDSEYSGPLRPVIGEFWDIARNPNLGAYDNGMLQQPIAFGIWQAGDGTWQLWASIQNTNVGGNTRLFARWEAPRIATANWLEGGVAMLAEAAFGELAGGLQAPHVTRLGDSWHMLYADLEEICHAVSADGKTFDRVRQASGMSAIFGEGPGMGTRDPMLFVAPDQYRVYYTAGEGTDFVRTSLDLATWSPPAVVARGVPGLNAGAAESPFVVQPVRGGDFFLFSTQRYGAEAQTSVYRSPNPFDFGVDNNQYFIGTLPVAAPEIVHYDGQWFIAALRPDLQGIQMASLYWKPD